MNVSQLRHTPLTSKLALSDEGMKRQELNMGQGAVDLIMALSPDESTTVSIHTSSQANGTQSITFSYTFLPDSLFTNQNSCCAISWMRAKSIASTDISYSVSNHHYENVSQNCWTTINGPVVGKLLYLWQNSTIEKQTRNFRTILSISISTCEDKSVFMEVTILTNKPNSFKTLLAEKESFHKENNLPNP